MPAQRSAMDQIGMEKQRISLRLIILIDIHIDDLSRRNKYQRPVLIVVGIAAIFNISALYIFQINRIESEVHLRRIDLGGLPRKVNYVNQRMQVFLVIEFIMLAYGVN